jgi:uncharacterized membrane protein YfcA
MSFLVIPITALIASILTFFSGFGLGTILLPVFTIYYDAPIAVALTAIVHFTNNIFKLGLIYKNIHWKIVLKFGFPSLIAALVGAYLLKNLFSKTIVIYNYYLEFTNINHQITLFNLIIGLLIIFFTLFEMIPYFKKLSFNEDKLIFGGLLSGFFGGLSGHQGALRSVFLVKLNLPKESFIATGTAIACIVDIARMSVYAFSFDFVHVQTNSTILLISIMAAILGALIGNKLLKKTTVSFLKWFVSLFMILIATLMILGFLS